MRPEVENKPACDDPRVYFAAERTLLAWIRTGLALMGFGFVVARFGVFLREMAVFHQAESAKPSRFSLWIGVTLVVVGALVNVMSAVGHWRTVRRLKGGQTLNFSPLSASVLLAVLLGLIGLLMTGYLLIGLPSVE